MPKKFLSVIPSLRAYMLRARSKGYPMFTESPDDPNYLYMPEPTPLHSPTFLDWLNFRNVVFKERSYNLTQEMWIEIQALRADVDRLNGEISKLCDEVKAARLRIQYLETELYDLQGVCGQLEEENDHLKSAIREAIESDDSTWADDILLEALEAEK